MGFSTILHFLEYSIKEDVFFKTWTELITKKIILTNYPLINVFNVTPQKIIYLWNEGSTVLLGNVK